MSFFFFFFFFFFFLIYATFSAAEAKRQLIAAGFHLLNENDEWDLKPGGRYFFTRNMSCLVAFAIGEKWVEQSSLLIKNHENWRKDYEAGIIN
jgi:aspartyl aminopeptidase